nr:unnamed protein product [Callosobruchus analis]
MSARSKRLLEMALGVETDIINTARFPLDNNTSEKECPVYDDIDNNSVSMIYDTDSTSSSCMTAPEPKFFKDKDGGLWYPTSNFEETNLHVCSGTQSDVLLTTNFHSRSLVENMSEVQKEKPFDIYDFSDVSPDIQRQNQIICQKYTEKGTKSYTIICSESTNDNAYFNIDSAEKPSDVAIKLRRQKEITNTSPKKKISDIASLTESETDYSDDNIRDKDFDFPVKSKQRRQASFDRLKGSTNFEMYLKGAIRPKKQRTEDTNVEYYPCIYCKELFSKKYLNRHAKICPVKNNSTTAYGESSQITLSQTAVACALNPNDVISKLNIKEQVFDMMKGDEISFVAKKDLLIAHYGELYLKSQKRERKEYTCSNKMRELARLLITYRSFVNDNERADWVGISLKIISNELIHLILKRSPGFTCESPEKSLEWRKNVKNFKMLVETRWNSEISSVANKNLNEKREKTLEFAKECQKKFLDNTDTDGTYKLFVYCTLALLVLFNRRRIGDVQYLKVNDYISEKKTNFQDFESTLSEGEKILTKKYKRVLNGGKGSRAVVLKRDKYISPDNKYMFALPKRKLQWTQADVVIRCLTKKMELKNAAAISSNRLRKHIATTMQILNMTKQDCKQFSKFMGHTEKTHEEFYE